MDLLLNRRQMMDLCPYKRIEYLESTGVQYIDTGIVATDTIGFYIDTQKTSNNKTDAMVIGSRGLNSSNSRCWVDIDHSSGYGFLILGWNDYTKNTRKRVDLDRFVAKFNYNNDRKAFVDNEEQPAYEQQLESQLNPQSVTLTMFCANDNGNKKFFGSFRIWRLRITSGETIVRDFVPVRVGNVGYMYDKVRKRLFGNSGTGDFILGPDL